MSRQEDLPYHLLVHDRARWRAVVEVALVIALWFAAEWATLVIFIEVSEVNEPWELSWLAFQAYWLISLALMTPCAFMAARIVKRDADLLSSRRGALRWPWLRRCIAIALAINLCGLALMLVAGAIVPVEESEHEWPGLGAFVQLALFLIVLVPFQAAGEEYAFRGTLMQAVGVFARNRWVAIAITSAAFAWIHPWEPSTMVSIFGMAVISAWLTIRTGGLEAAIAEHAVWNTTLMIGASAGGITGLDELLTSTDEDWFGAVLSISSMLLYATLVTRAQHRDPP